MLLQLAHKTKARRLALDKPQTLQAVMVLSPMLTGHPAYYQ